MRDARQTSLAIEDAAMAAALSDVHAMFGRSEQALAMLHFAAWLHPDNPATLQRMIALNDSLRRPREVLELLAKLEALPGAEIASRDHLARARALARLGMVDEARVSFGHR